LLTSLDHVDMEDADLRGDNLGLAAERLSALHAGTVRALSMDRSLLLKVAAARHPALEILWGINSGQIQALNVSGRLKAVLLVSGVLSFLR
jgi:hypothetical protein